MSQIFTDNKLNQTTAPKGLKLVKYYVLLATLAPALAFASSGGDQTFKEMIDQVTKYLTGSMGMALVLLAFLGAAAAVAGHASMRVMFPVLGLCLALHYGPNILTAVFGATGDLSSGFLHHVEDLNASNLILLLLASTVFVAGFVRYRARQTTSADNLG